jgi:hypothetical protein
VHKRGGVVGVGALKDVHQNASEHAYCSLDDVAPRLVAAADSVNTAAGGSGTKAAQTSQSVVDILWELTDSTPSGEYRLVYTGDRLAAPTEEPIAFEGVSRPFAVINCVLEPELPQCGERG